MIYLLPYHHATKKPSQVEKVDPVKWLEQFYEKPFCYITPSGKDAISVLLKSLDLKLSDEIFVTTTFGYPNVSSCVTSTIFNYCKPSRIITSATRAIFAIHEFGVPHADLLNLRNKADELSIPLIEDLAHTLNSFSDSYRVGENADYIICSFPKIFPVLYGGALIGQKVAYDPSELDRSKIRDTADFLGYSLPMLEKYSDSRRVVFQKLTRAFSRIGLSPVFELNDSITPWFFPVQMQNWQKCIAEAQNYGIECGLWHGTNIVVFPCHQFLSDKHIEKVANFASLFV